MAVDPTISLGIKPPQVGFEQLGQMANTVNALNQNKLFQQTYQARQAAGQMMAAAPDADTGLDNIMHSPYAPFVGEFLTQARQAKLADIQYQNEMSQNARQGVETFGKLAPGAALDPGVFNGALKAAISTTSKLAQPQLLQALQGLQTATIGDLPSDYTKWTPEQSALFKKRLIGLGIGSGMTTDQLGNLVQTRGQIDTGGGVQTGTLAPPAEGGGFTPSTGTTKTIAPQTVGMPGGLTTTIGSGGAGTTSRYGSSGSGNPLSLGPSSAGAGASPNALTPSQIHQSSLNPDGRPRTFTGDGSLGTSPQARAAAGGASADLAGDGKPLYTEQALSSGALKHGTAIGGFNTLAPSDVAQNDGLIKEYEGSGLTQFNNAQTTLASLRYMDAAFDNLAKGGGFLVPGVGAQFRGDLAKTVGTLYQMMNKEPPVEMGKIASIEDFVKETNRMAPQVMAQLVGQQHQAAETISRMTQSVPGIENTYLGGKLIIAGLQAASNRMIDQRNFTNAWQTKNQSFIGATEAFNKAHPAEQYAEQVLSSFGLNEKGFQSPEAVKEAVKNGYLTKGQGVQLLQQHFPDKFGTGQQ